MNTIVKVFTFNILTIFFFTLIYTMIPEENFIPVLKNNTRDYKITFLDYLFYSTTIQAGVGLAPISPITKLSKILTLIQHYILICSGIIVLYYFTIHHRKHHK